jgi:hypothetical protein
MEGFNILENKKNESNFKDLINGGFHGKLDHEKLLEKININPDSVIHDLNGCIKNTFESSKVVFFGVYHSSSISHERISEYLSNLPKNKKINLFIEYPPVIQENINNFLSTGKFINSDNEDFYKKVYDDMKTESFNIPDNFKGTFLDDHYSLAQILPILEKAKELNLNVCAGDKYHNESINDDEYLLIRDEGMLEYLKESIEKYDLTIVVAGINHILNNEYDLEIGEYPHKTTEKVTALGKSTKRLLGDDKVKTFYLENELHNIKYASEDQSVGSALFDKFKNDFGSEEVGLEIKDNCINGVDNIKKEFPVDYYIPVLDSHP